MPTKTHFFFKYKVVEMFHSYSIIHCHHHHHHVRLFKVNKSLMKLAGVPIHKQINNRSKNYSNKK